MCSNLIFSSATIENKEELLKCLAEVWSTDLNMSYEDSLLMFTEWAENCFQHDNLSFIVRDKQTNKIIGGQLNSISERTNTTVITTDETSGTQYSIDKQYMSMLNSLANSNESPSVRNVHEWAKKVDAAAEAHWPSSVTRFIQVEIIGILRDYNRRGRCMILLLIKYDLY
jgi:hypothetical protein